MLIKTGLVKSEYCKFIVIYYYTKQRLKGKKNRNIFVKNRRKI